MGVKAWLCFDAIHEVVEKLRPTIEELQRAGYRFTPDA
jgi:hypothetical protein